jgi:DGQHR domain-containing protein
MPTGKPITVNALRLKQQPDVPIYVFGIDGKMIHSIASVSYAQRNKSGELSGYQRGPAANHIRDILDYLSTSDAILPNAIVIAFTSDVTFEPLKGTTPSEWGTFGRLSIPLPKNGSESRVGWIVDGQQRVTALSQLDRTKHFPVVVVGFQSDSDELQRNQFVLVNKTKPLPKNLLNEILPDITAPLTKTLARQKLAAQVVTRLRFDSRSPFYNRVKGLGVDGENVNISQNALMEVITNSMKQRGVLFEQYKSEAKKQSYDRMANVMSVFFDGVRRTWPEAWDSNPGQSRLVHGVGIVALGHLMDKVMHEVDESSTKAVSMVYNRLLPLRDRCAWMEGRWPTINRRWNELQNTSTDKSLLTDYLVKAYREE